MPLSITADLRLEVDGVVASVTTVDGDIVVDCDQPSALIARARTTGRRAPDLSRLVAGLPMGLPPGTRLVLRGPSGTVLSARLSDGRTIRRRDVRIRRPLDMASRSQRRLVIAAVVAVLVLVGRAVGRRQR